MTTYKKYGSKNLGPIINYYLLKLHSYLCSCDSNNTTVLFALRAGLNIQYLYRVWLTGRGVSCPASTKLFKTSRMLAIKAAYKYKNDLFFAALEKELGYHSTEEKISFLSKNLFTRDKVKIGKYNADKDIRPFLYSGSHDAFLLENYLSMQSELYEKYIQRLSEGAERLIIVDSGWKGTTQLLLENTFNQYSWEGIYFGCIGRANILDLKPENMHGMVFDCEHFDPDKPETSFLLHRHLIESLFEPNISTFDHINSSDLENINSTSFSLGQKKTEPWDNTIHGVAEYVQQHSGDGITSIITEFDRAMTRLAQRLRFPDLGDVKHLSGKARSLDLGRDGGINSTISPVDRFEHDSPALRIAQAIWPTGQAAVEFSASPDKLALIQQKLSMDFSKASQKLADPSESKMPADIYNSSDHVSVITRTKDRPLLLRRAAKSVSEQSFKNYTWVVVNDGGNLKDVEAVVKASNVDPSKVIICSNETGIGMEAASNLGITNSRSEYVAIHDDDDSWHPDFLLQCVRFLGRSATRYDGVITKSEYISEEIVDDKVVEVARHPYNDWVNSVQIAEVATENIFAPIAFVYRRQIWEEISGYDESLPVLGDWDFNLRFLLKSNIGVIRRTLAYYHHRDQNGSDGNYSNSVIGASDLHLEYNSILKNKYVRLASKDEAYMPLMQLLSNGFILHELRQRLGGLDTQISSLGTADPNTSVQNLAFANNSSMDHKAKLLQRELDNRWVLLNVLALEVINARKMDTDVASLLKAAEKKLEFYIEKVQLVPPPDFHEESYLSINQDISASLQKGKFASGFDHYMKHGLNEGRNRRG